MAHLMLTCLASIVQGLLSVVACVGSGVIDGLGSAENVNAVYLWWLRAISGERAKKEDLPELICMLIKVLRT